MSEKIVPIKGNFQDWRSLLASIMERDDIEHIVVLATHSDGSTGFAHSTNARALNWRGFRSICLRKHLKMNNPHHWLHLGVKTENRKKNLKHQRRLKKMHRPQPNETGYTHSAA